MNNRDLVMHQALMKVLNEGTFSLKAREVPTFLEVYKWTQGLTERLSPKPKDEGEIEPLPKSKDKVESKPNRARKVRRKKAVKK
jgi:hypothetical protein